MTIKLLFLDRFCVFPSAPWLVFVFCVTNRLFCLYLFLFQPSFSSSPLFFQLLPSLSSLSPLFPFLPPLFAVRVILWNKWELNPTDSINEAVEIEALTRRATLRKCKHVCASNCLHAENRGTLWRLGMVYSWTKGTIHKEKDVTVIFPRNINVTDIKFTERNILKNLEILSQDIWNDFEYLK